MTFSGRLRAFAQDLAPSQHEITRAGKTIDVISRKIHAHFKGRGAVDRITPFGSYPKKTSLSGSMDIDIIVYVSNKDPPFYDMIDEFYNLVRKNFDFFCRKNSYGVYFTYESLKVDLLPARNFLPSSSSHDPNVDRSVRVQHSRALNYVKHDVPEQKRDYYSTSLSGISVLFEQNRDSFSHCVSRLAKYWSSTVPVDSMTGNSSIMEYLGAFAAQLESEGHKQDIYWAFHRFLNLLDCSDTIFIYWTEFYALDDIPDYIMDQCPLLLDPCNPYNNFLTSGNANILRRMWPYAKRTLVRLEEAFNHGHHANIKSIFKFDASPNRFCLSPTPQTVPLTRFNHGESTRWGEGICSAQCACWSIGLFMASLCLLLFLIFEDFNK